MAKISAIKVSAQLRRIIDDCGLSRYEISKRTGIDEATLSRFMYGERGLSMKALDRLGEALALTINMRRKPSKPARK
jgi:transcriptional regulator with XRE-family HTH domain